MITNNRIHLKPSKTRATTRESSLGLEKGFFGKKKGKRSENKHVLQKEKKGKERNWSLSRAKKERVMKLEKGSGVIKLGKAF